VGANKPATPAIFVLKSIAPTGRSYGGFALTTIVIGDKADIQGKPIVDSKAYTVNSARARHSKGFAAAHDNAQAT
jgi:hypothetical protein